MKISDIPTADRPYEKCRRMGFPALTDAELLAIILRTGTKTSSAVTLAQNVLHSFHPASSLLGLLHCSSEDLMKINGVGAVKAIQIQCVMELSRRVAKASAGRSLSFSDPVTIYEYYREDMRHKEQEMMLLLMLDTRNHLIADKVISKGTVNASLITPREIFVESLKNHAVNVILLHNHPSGDAMPSESDILITKRIYEAGKIVGIHLLDHLIVGDTTFTSFRKSGMIFSEHIPEGTTGEKENHNGKKRIWN